MYVTLVCANLLFLAYILYLAHTVCHNKVSPLGIDKVVSYVILHFNTDLANIFCIILLADPFISAHFRVTFKQLIPYPLMYELSYTLKPGDDENNLVHICKPGYCNVMRSSFYSGYYSLYLSL